MIIIRLAGGLGNQIFQIGAGLLLAKKSGIQKIIINDSELGKYDIKRNNELKEFFDFSKLNNIKIEFKNTNITKFRIPKILKFKIAKTPFVTDSNFQIALRNPNKQFMIIDGYFQRCLTQQDFEEEINFLKKIIIQDNKKQLNGCVIHIRGGDFVKLGWNIVAPKEYYIKAIETMKNIYQQNRFFIVTDDKKYSQTILNELDINYEFIGSSIYEDFKLIGSFKYRILSSSTFALWASALGNNEESIVIAPKYWIPNSERKIYLPNEIRIKF